MLKRKKVSLAEAILFQFDGISMEYMNKAEKTILHLAQEVRQREHSIGTDAPAKDYFIHKTV